MTFYRFARAVVLSVCKVACRVRVVGREHVPRSGAYIVAPSHRSILDVPFSAFVTTRTICFLAKEELFSTWFGNAFFTALGAVRVERGTADRAALRALEAELARGQPVAVFPEGTRESGPRIAPLFDGAAYLAVKLGVPIVPVGVGGSEDILPKGKFLPRPRRVAVVVGKPIMPPVFEGRGRRAAATKLTDELAAELQRVFTDALLIAG
ncbi:MAG: lysophospholipid acyltransferase family protein [Acidimicrobiia bacterium]